ncbi:methyltransferase domain-containing protein [Allomuricauda sp. d1]|uniref:methyltransferase domain-containing protein n=1 Tax=Allomuricauda sp. d1 TaxID=3136725 RepID=UPI0031E2973D
MDLTLRSTETELMDAPDIGVETLKMVFEDINKTNRLLGGNAITVQKVMDWVYETKKESYTILDAGCGDGNMLRALATAFRKAGIRGHFSGIELRDDIIELAREKSLNFPEIAYQKGNIMHLNTENHSCDIVICTLTVHHFENSSIPSLLKTMLGVAKIGVIINDLQRSRLACMLFRLFSMMFMKTNVAKNDGLVSIKRAFKKSELIAFSKKIPGVMYEVKWKWAFRYVWTLQNQRPN